MEDRTPGGRGGWRGLLVNVGLSLASALVFLLVLEGGARLLESHLRPRRTVAAYLWDWDVRMPGGFYVVKSGAAGWPPWDEWNHDGLRDRTRTHEKPEGYRRIAILGDSVTYGADLPREDAFPQRLEARFQAEGRPVEVMNVGLAGWSTRQQRIAWQRIVRHYHPDQAVLAVCLNDIPELHNNLDRPPRWLARAYEASSLVRLAVNAQGREVDSVERLFLEPDAPPVRAAMERFFDEVRALRREVEADGARFAVLVFPFRFQVEPHAPPPIVQERIESFCASEHLECLDLLPAIARVGPSVFHDYDHLGSDGAAYVARVIYESGLLVTAEPRDVVGEALGNRRDDVGALVDALRGHPSAGVRAACAIALASEKASGRAAVEALFAALGDRSEFVRASAARALARFDLGRDDVPLLATALSSTDPYVVAFAAWTLGNLGEVARPAVPELAEALARDDTNAAVAAAIARIGPAAADAVDVLIAALRADSADRRWRAARTLGRIGDTAAPAVPALTAALADPSIAVRQHAARALGRIGPAARPAVAALRAAGDDRSAKVRREARRALALLEGRGPSEPEPADDGR